MTIDKDKTLSTAADELRRSAAERLCATAIIGDMQLKRCSGCSVVLTVASMLKVVH